MISYNVKNEPSISDFFRLRESIYMITKYMRKTIEKILKILYLPKFFNFRVRHYGNLRLQKTYIRSGALKKNDNLREVISSKRRPSCRFT